MSANPTPVRFDQNEEAALQELKTATGLSKSEVVRRAFRFAAPKFLRREINILDLVKMETARK